jgi:hypothetical protein
MPPHVQELVQAGLVGLTEEDLSALPEDAPRGAPIAVSPPQDGCPILEIREDVRVLPQLEVEVALPALPEASHDSVVDRGALVPLVDPLDDDRVPHLDNHVFLNNVFCLLWQLG